MSSTRFCHKTNYRAVSKLKITLYGGVTKSNALLTIVQHFRCPLTLVEMTIAQAVAKKKDFCLESDGDGGFKLRRRHNYYYQVIG